MPNACLVRRLPQWPAVRFVVTLSLGVLADVSLTGCATPSYSPSAYPPFGPPNGLRLSDDRSEIIMTGPMENGLSVQIKQLLDANPNISAIRLESGGGSGNEGYKVALLVKQHHLATFSATLCASACTFVYMAGEPRFFVASGRLGFHSSSVNGMKSAEGNAFSQILYQEAGVPQAFIDKAMETAPKDIWFPTTRELMKARIVTDLVANQNFMPSSRRYWATEADLDRALKSDTVIATVARLDPASYKKIRGIFLDGARQGRGIAQMAAASRDLLAGELMPSYYRRAPDDLLIRYQSLQLEGLRDIEKNAPGTCVTVAAPTASISDFSSKRLSTRISAQLDQAMADIITAALLRPDHPDDDALNRHTAEEFEKTLLVQSHPVAKSLAELKQNSHNQALYCRVLETYEQAILDQPPVTAARIIRAHELKREQDKPPGSIASH